MADPAETNPRDGWVIREIPEGRTHILQLCDHEFEFLSEFTGVIDRDLEVLGKEIDAHHDPDGWGLLDSFESRVSLGLVACQLYLTAIIGSGKPLGYEAREKLKADMANATKKDKDKLRQQRQARKEACLVLGPRHSSGRSIAEIVHAAGNYVKHSPEEDIHTTTKQVLAPFRIWRDDTSDPEDTCDYPMTNLLLDLVKPGPHQLAPLVALLEQWREAVILAGLV
jgi:hypothetical protein